jgi:hypothetical protein
MSGSDPVGRWHDYVAARDPALLEALIAEECVFTSPAVHTPQVGKAITLKYLTAAMSVLGTDAFRYVGEWRTADGAVLEFETQVDGLAVNGVDIIRWGDDGRIVSFKVMARPLKGLMKLVERMGAELAKP